MTNETPWYCRGEIGEYILDQIESVIDDRMSRLQFVTKLEGLGLDAGEIRKIMLEQYIY